MLLSLTSDFFRIGIDYPKKRNMVQPVMQIMFCTDPFLEEFETIVDASVDRAL